MSKSNDQVEVSEGELISKLFEKTQKLTKEAYNKFMNNQITIKTEAGETVIVPKEIVKKAKQYYNDVMVENMKNINNAPRTEHSPYTRLDNNTRYVGIDPYIMDEELKNNNNHFKYNNTMNNANLARPMFEERQVNHVMASESDIDPEYSDSLYASLDDEDQMMFMDQSQYQPDERMMERSRCGVRIDDYPGEQRMDQRMDERMERRMDERMGEKMGQKMDEQMGKNMDEKIVKMDDDGENKVTVRENFYDTRSTIVCIVLIIIILLVLGYFYFRNTQML